MTTILSVDLSGPRNAEGTGVAWFKHTDDGLELAGTQVGATDSEIAAVPGRLARSQQLVVGLEAPLSYGTEKGSGPADEELRAKMIQLGGHPGNVMAPTAPRTVYLTLRGIQVARMLSLLEARHSIRIVEVHPGAALLLRGASPDDVRALKRDPLARSRIVLWLEDQGTRGLDAGVASSDHLVAACAGALAAWDWSRGRSPWVARADPPVHPFDFAG